jgi:FAD/FMN-containing dehydrogenase
MRAVPEMPAEDLLRQLEEFLGADGVITDPLELEYYSADVYSAGARAALVIRPSRRAGLADAVGLLTASGYAVIPRGGGMSYTSGYIPVAAKSVVVALDRINEIVDLDTENMTITVEAGVTWQQIHNALAGTGLRLPFFGTFSGSRATVGGGMSNGALFMGTGRYGTAAEIVLGLEVITAEGRLLQTGQAAFKNGKPFYRTYGPDLTGLFVHDAGALGIKTLISMRLMRAPEHEDYASFVLTDSVCAAAALSDIARAGIAEEAYVFDPDTNRRSLDASDLAADLKRLLGVVKAQKGLFRGVREGAALVGAGRNFIADDVFTLHVVCSGNGEQAVARDLAECRRILDTHGGGEIANSIPKAARANPFEPLNGILGTKGDRWAALNAKVAHSDAHAVIAATEAIFATHASDMSRHGVTHSFLFIAISNHAFSIEPVLRWFDEWLPAHRRTPQSEYLAKLDEPGPNPGGRQLVAKIRADIVQLFAERGAASNQIGKTYPYYASLNGETARLVLDLKRSLDPNGLMNPGALGLPEFARDS